MIQLDRDTGSDNLGDTFMSAIWNDAWGRGLGPPHHRKAEVAVRM